MVGRRHVGRFLAVASLVGAWVVSSPALTARAADPPACPFASSSVFRCSRAPAAGPLGPITLLGDSVLVGSAEGMSSPGLPTMLAAAGWGPVHLQAGVGYQVRNDAKPDVSAVHWIARWRAAGWSPSTVALNLGGNDGCADPACMRTRIVGLLDAIGPSTVVWWALVKHSQYPSGTDTPRSLMWNDTLRRLAAERPNLVLWDWPAALAAANPPILMDLARVHPVSGVQYVKRSRLMADHLTSQVGGARLIGAPVAAPASGVAPADYQPVPIERIVPAPGGATARIEAGKVFTVDLSARAPAGATAVAITLGAEHAARPTRHQPSFRYALPGWRAHVWRGARLYAARRPRL